MTNELRQLFEPFDGETIKRAADGSYVVYFPYVMMDPIKLPTSELAEQVDSAIREAHTTGVHDGQGD